MISHEALTDRIARPVRESLSRMPRWSRPRIAGESVLAVVLAGVPGMLDALGSGFGVRTVLIVTGVALLSPARRVFPATVLVASAVMAAQLPSAALLLVCASWSAGSRVTRPGRLAAAYGSALLLYAALSTYEEIRAKAELPLVTGAFSTAAFLVLAVVPGLMARYRAQRRSLLEALGRTNQQLVREQAMVARQARLLERGRIAQDMHDSLGHQLVLITVHAGALQVDPDLTDRQREGVGILRDASVAAMEELRETVGILRDGREDHDGREDRDGREGQDALGRAGGPAASAAVGVVPVSGAGGEQRPGRVLASIDDLVASSRAAGATVEIHRSGSVRPLAPAADHAAYRVAQEGLTNAHKHAPGAPISLALRYEPDTLIVEVTNGPPKQASSVGPPVVSGGQGLTGMAERIRLVGGMLHTGPTADGGFRVAGMLPYGSGTGSGSGTGEAGAGHPGAVSDRPGPEFSDPAGPTSAYAGDVAIAPSGAREDRGDFAAIMSRRGKLALGCAGTAVVLVVGVIALGAWGVSALMEEVDKATIPPEVYESVKVGDPEDDVQDRLPDEDSFLTADLGDAGPPLPEGATCRHFASDDAEDTSTIFRFCFRDGELVRKLTFDGDL
ncbi:histidine kinase [Streptomyces griseus]|uniref:histidine kinase n=2 Tax=Streptomyces TaxID=1883 RepID=A0ABU2W070_9ACTN|nr:histidine kinase [Streptomyces griseus]MDT0490903.1 histidine kinase [Streptomyces griseus]